MGLNMLLTIGGVILLSTFVLYANGLMGDNVKVSSDNEYTITAIGLAQSIIDEAKTKSFDENTIDSTVTQTDSLSSTLGRDGVGETLAIPDTANDTQALSYARFDDVDDYNGYIRIANTPRAEGYRISTTVTYASETSPDSSKSTRTFCKKMTVSVTSPFIPYPVNMSYAFVY